MHDLGKPSRFVNMLRVAKPTSPMSVGTWILSLYGPAAGLAGAAELPFLPRFVRRLLRPFARPAGIAAALAAPAVASYTAVLLADTATPGVELGAPRTAVRVRRLGSVGRGRPGHDRAPAMPTQVRRDGWRSPGWSAKCSRSSPWSRRWALRPRRCTSGTAGRIERAGKICTGVGGIGALLAEVFGRRNPRRGRAFSFVAGLGLLGGSACTRFAIFEAGQASARDPKYTVVPQRERLSGR